MKQDLEDSRHWIADEGKMFIRKADELVMGPEMWLGYTYYLDEKKLPEAQEEIISQFEEVDITEEFELMYLS